MRQSEHVLSGTVLCSNVFFLPIFSSYFSEAFPNVTKTSSERLRNVLRTSSERLPNVFRTLPNVFRTSSKRFRTSLKEQNCQGCRYKYACMALHFVRFRLDFSRCHGNLMGARSPRKE